MNKARVLRWPGPHSGHLLNKPLREIIIDESEVMGIWSNPIGEYWYGYRSTKGVYQIRSVMQLPRQLWEFIVENEINNKFIPKPQKLLLRRTDIVKRKRRNRQT